MRNSLDLIIVGNKGGTNVGASLQRAAEQLGLKSAQCDSTLAFNAPLRLGTLSWRLLGHRPPRLRQFTRFVVRECERWKPSVLIATGLAPLAAEGLRDLGKLGIRRVSYLTDDPWNPDFRSEWFFSALREYDRVFTPRRSNMEDLISHGCGAVAYLPFGYDEFLWVKPKEESQPAARRPDVFFAGAADRWRIQFVRELLGSGIRIALAGDYWGRVPDLRKSVVGHLEPAHLRAYTRCAAISLCLVRRANRDGHVMRSFEIPAIGGACMVAEDTHEHRAIFGEDGRAVRYCRSPQDTVAAVELLLKNRTEREHLARAAKDLIVGSGNTYKDRLRSLLQEVE